MVFGHDGINETNISTHQGKIMFQSHIAGSWNDNVWNESNYEQLRLSLNFLKPQGIQFNTIQEII